MQDAVEIQTQVFLSYSRKDSAFVRKIHEALEQQGFDVWVDWGDIPPSVNFREEILPGIDASENFVFVVSPDSVESAICAWELEHAVEQNKRLFPLVVRTTLAEQVPDTVRDLQWLFFRDEDPFDPAFDQLVRALRTDLDYARAHTKLLTRAEEWESAGRGSSLLLRGKELKQAEDWLSRGSDTGQHPTALHEAYIANSRRGVKRRLRAQLYGILSGLLISVLAIWFYQVADDRQRFTQARDLAVKARGLLPEDDGLRRGLLLGMESLTHYPTQEADSLLREGLSLMPHRIFSVDTEYVQELTLSPSGDYLVVQHTEYLQLWYLPAQRMIREWPLVAPGYSVKAGMSLSGDATRLARARDHRTVEVIGLDDGEPLFVWQHDKALRSLILSPDGDLLFILDADGEFHAHNIEIGQYSKQGPQVKMTSIAINADGNLLALADIENRIHLLEPATAEIRRILPHDAPLIEVRFTGDGRLFTRTDKGVTRVWDSSTGEVLAFIRLDDTGIISSIRTDGAELYTLLATGSLDIRDLGSGALVARLDLTPEARLRQRQGRTVFNIQFSELKTAVPALDQQRIAIVNPAVVDFTKEGDRVEVWQVPRTEYDRMAIMESAYVPFAVNFSTDNDALLVMGARGEVRILDAQTLDRRLTVAEDTAVTAADLSSNGRWLATATAAGNISIRDLQIPGDVMSLEGQWPVGAVSFLDQGKRILAAAGDRTIRVWSVKDGKLLNRVPFDGMFQLVKISADRRFLVAAGNSKLHRMNLENIAVDRSYYFGAPDIEPMAVAISGDGKHIAMTGSDRVIRVYRGASPIPTLKFNREQLDNELALSRDGRFLAAGNKDGLLTVWDLDKERNILTINAASGRAFRFLDLTFSPDNRQLFAATTEGLKHVHPYTPYDLIEAICAVLPRNWSMAEWRRYFSTGPYQPACALSPLGEEALVRHSQEFIRLRRAASEHSESPRRLYEVR